MERKIGLILIIFSLPFIVVLFLMGVINFLFKGDYQRLEGINYAESLRYNNYVITINDEYLKEITHYKKMYEREPKNITPKEEIIKIKINNVDFSTKTKVSINPEDINTMRYFGWVGIAKANTNSKNEELLIVQTVKQQEKWRIIHIPKHGEVYIEIVDLNRLFMHPKYSNLLHTTNTTYGGISTFTWFTQLPFAIGIFPLVHPLGTMCLGLFLCFKKRKILKKKS